jgi:hypothetical protein
MTWQCTLNAVITKQHSYKQKELNQPESCCENNIMILFYEKRSQSEMMGSESGSTYIFSQKTVRTKTST